MYTKLHFLRLSLCCIALAIVSQVVAQSPTIQSVTPVSTTIGVFEKFEASVQLTAVYTNPYDYDDILVKAEFTAPSGKKDVMEGFFMQNYTLNTSTGNITPTGTSGFSIRYSPSETGNYSYTVTCISTIGNTTTSAFNFESVASNAKGFVRKNASNYLNFDNGSQYIMIGQNMGWQQNNKYLNFKTWTDKMAANNANFIRLWQCAWGLGIEWSGTPYEGLKKYSQVNSFYTDKLLDECKAKDIYMMLCINHHGMVSSTVNPNWNENPYKSTNGGPCVNTWDYFINATAKALHKNRLRYIVARWGYSRNIMSWELFNEVEWTDQFSTYKTQIKDWHQEMAQYLKEKDPLKHLVTTSYAHDDQDPATWNLPEMDFTQTHYYNSAANVETVLVGGIKNYLANFNKPTYTGEFGINASSSNLSTIDPNGTHIHNSVWATLFGGGMGAGSSWWWDTYIEPRNLYTHYKAPAIVVSQLPLASQNYKPTSGTVTGGGAADLVVSPGSGWGKPPAANFTIDASGNMTPAASGLSTYMYGTQCKAAEKNAPTFTVTFSAPSQFKVRTGNDISTFCNAQRVQIILNGTEALNSPATANTTFTINVPAGTHTIKVDNAGGDWYTVSSYTFTNMGSPLNTYLLKSADNRRTAGWVHNKKYNWIDAAPGNATPPTISGATLSIPGMADATYEIKWYECTNGTVQSTTVAVVAGGTLTLPVPDVAWDLAFMANDITTLPIKLSAFSGIYEKHLNRLFMTISEAKNVKDIWIERSNDSRTFETIGKIAVQNHQFTGNHQYVDESRVPGKNYYRLNIVDFDGSRQFSKIIVLEQLRNENSIKVYPNPAKDQFTIKGLLDNPDEKYQATITDINGRRIWTQSINSSNGSANQTIYVEKFPVGFYFLAIINKDGEIVLTEKIIKQ
jgi:hypothetical protein